LTFNRIGVFSNTNQRLASVVIVLLWCQGLLTCQTYLMSHSVLSRGAKSTLGMSWNLFLSVLPLIWSSAFRSADARRRPVSAGIYFFLWLLFLPNAPYLLTDLVHLIPVPHVPPWYLLAVLMSCAGAGTMLGYLSLIQVQSVIEQKWGRRIGWAVAVGSLLLCGFGIYVGRFLQKNSWDIFVHPLSLMRTIGQQCIDPGANPQPLVVTVVFGVGLVIGYLVLRVFSASLRP
jgi:uncharacterized membrane protein